MKKEATKNFWVLPLLAWAYFTTAPNPVDAGVIQVLGEKNEWGCTHVFLGEVEPGDIHAFERVFYGNELHSLCLNSPGGSLIEAVEISNFLATKSVHTVIPPGWRCESACAFVFMSGGGFDYSNDVIFDRPRPIRRTLYVSGFLGFHSPRLSVGEGQPYSSGELQAAFNTGVAALSQFAFLQPTIVPRSLLLEISATSSDDMFYVETIQQAKEWGINIGGLGVPYLPIEDLIENLCLSYPAPELQGPGVGERDSIVGLTISSVFGSPFSRFGVSGGWAYAGPLGDTCTFDINFENMQLIGGFSNDYFSLFDVSNAHLFSPDLSIAQAARLPVYTSEQLFNAFARFLEVEAANNSSSSYNIEQVTFNIPSSAISSYWNHNGSRMGLVASGSERTFFYVRPRSGMAEVGVRYGTLLFQGERSAGEYIGTAMIFSSNGCGVFPYNVAGPIAPDDRAVTVYGDAPLISDDCSILGYRADTLVFELE